MPTSWARAVIFWSCTLTIVSSSNTISASTVATPSSVSVR